MERMMKNKIKLNIAGSEYVISSDEDEKYVRELGDEVDRKIHETLKSNTRISTTVAAVLVALGYCDEAKKSAASADNLRLQVKEYLEDAARARMEADTLRRQKDHLSDELQKLRERMSGK